MEITLNNIKLNTANIFPFIQDDEFNSIKGEAVKAYNMLLNYSGTGNDFLGWLDLPSDVMKKELLAIEDAAHFLRKKSDVIVVTGIGGSYLGARAVIEALQNNFKFLQKKKNRYPLVIFAGQNISEDYHAELLEVLEDLKYSVIVISKSGTTTEPAIAFRLLRNHLERKYGKEIASTHIVVITDEKKGALKKLAGKEGYKQFVIPADLGGRYSVVSAVGLLPVACAGFSIKEFLKGAEEMETALKGKGNFDKNPAMLYAAVRNLMYRKGKTTELFASFFPSLYYFIEWWKQLYGESEGKDGKGIFPAGAVYSTDLHSLGQYVQDGLRNIFETFIWIEKPKYPLSIPYADDNSDELNYLKGKHLNFVNEKAMLGTMQAHLDGGVPNMTFTIPELTESILGGLVYFFEFACALSGYMLGVNPFDQPGVEMYKKNMFKLLGK
ncbi:MAG: glucose-6-phosphate isomerase [Ignavibacteria bacterium]|nr:glucose-6-phosphate isomerase [Ignavibacteria bacterium]